MIFLRASVPRTRCYFRASARWSEARQGARFVARCLFSSRRLFAEFLKRAFSDILSCPHILADKISLEMRGREFNFIPQGRFCLTSRDTIVIRFEPTPPVFFFFRDYLSKLFFLRSHRTDCPFNKMFKQSFEMRFRESPDREFRPSARGPNMFIKHALQKYAYVVRNAKWFNVYARDWRRGFALTAKPLKSRER